MATQNKSKWLVNSMKVIYLSNNDRNVYVRVQIRMGLVSHTQLKNQHFTKFIFCILRLYNPTECSTGTDVVWMSILTLNNQG